MPPRRQPRTARAGRAHRTGTSDRLTPQPVAVSGFIGLLLGYAGLTSEAVKSRNTRLVRAMAEVFPHIEFLRIASSDPVVVKMVEDLSPTQFTEVVGPYMAKLLPTLSVDQMWSVLAGTFAGMEPEHQRVLLRPILVSLQASLAFAVLVPVLFEQPSTEHKTIAFRIGTSIVDLDSTSLARYRDKVLKFSELSAAEAQALSDEELASRLLGALARGVGSGETQGILEQAKRLLGKAGLKALAPQYEAGLRKYFPRETGSTEAPLSPKVQAPIAQTDERPVIEDDRIITKDGVRFFPIPLAAEHGHAPRTTLLNWIKAKVEFQGRPLNVYQSATAHKAFVAEESVERLAHRFVKWPSNEPAGEVILGETKDKSGYIGIAKAARSLGVDHHTMWLWTARGTAPTEKPLDVIKCSASDQFYIRERDISELKKHIPRTGLRAGRRPQRTAQPS